MTCYANITISEQLRRKCSKGKEYQRVLTILTCVRACVCVRERERERERDKEGVNGAARGGNVMKMKCNV